MAKNKSKGTIQKKQEFVISEQQRNSNPIFRTVYKRIRNLNKKLSNIDALRQLDEATLKPEQRAKLASRNEVEGQVKKNEEFVQLYKSILEESGGVIFDNSEDLIKIATLLAIGQAIDKSRSLSQNKSLSQVYNSYNSITSPDLNKQLVDRIGDIFTTLFNYIKDPSQYRFLQEHLQNSKSAIQPKTQTRQQPKQQTVQQVKIEQRKTTKMPQQPSTVQHQRKNNSEVKKQQVQKQLQKQTKQIKQVKQKQQQKQRKQVKQAKNQTKQIKQTKQQRLTQIDPPAKDQNSNRKIKNEQKQAQKQVLPQKQTEATKTLQIGKRDKIQQPKKTTDQLSRPEVSKLQEKKEQDGQNQKSRRQNNTQRGYKKQYRNFNTYKNDINYRNRQQKAYQTRYPQNRNTNERNGNYNNYKNGQNNNYTQQKYKPKNQDRKYAEKNRKGKTKDSDTSLQPTPEKNKNKPRFIEKTD